MKLAIIGYGKMGRLIEQLAPDYGLTVHARIDVDGDFQQASGADVAIEFTEPDAVAGNVETLAALGLPVVVGTTGWHTHTCDQILVVTSGSGMVAVEGGAPQEINIGDVVHIKAGERHWHGSKANSTMGHITITAVGGQAKWG